MNQREVLNAIIAKNGFKHQMTVCIEELAELIKELTKQVRDKGSDMRLWEEIADVEICLAQLKLMRPGYKHIGIFKRFKIARLKAFYVEGNLK